jgi:LysR family transcriptional regulator, low CO2-responsive transcriptional regulator
MSGAPTLRQLEVFATVARLLSYTRAAAELHLSQPGASRQVQQLERELDEQLLVRNGRGIQLTGAGHDVLAAAVRVQAALDELRADLDARRGLRRGHLRVVATTTAGEYLLPPLVAAFRRGHPLVQVSLRIANRAVVLQTLTDGEADLAVMGRPPGHADWISRPILPNELVAIAAPDHPRVAGAPLDPAELTGETLFLREPGSGTRRAVEGFLTQAGLPLEVGVEFGSDNAIKQAVMAGLGIAILSRQAIELELALGRLRILPVKGLPLSRPWYLVKRTDRGGSAAVDEFTRLLESTVLR